MTVAGRACRSLLKPASTSEGVPAAKKRSRTSSVTGNEHGHRTSLGKTWGYRSVLTVIRNPAYPGRVNFRGKCHPAAHPPLADEATFQAAQQLLDERGENP